MTEQQWLTGDNLPAKVRHLHDIGDVDALRAFVVECRRASTTTFAFDGNDWLDLARSWAINDWHKSFPHPDPRADILRDVAGNPWRKMELLRLDVPICDKCGGKKSIYTGMDGMKWIPCVSCPIGDCPWLTPHVLNIASSLRENPHDAGAWAALHDALCEAGCDNADILQHCRGLGRCPTCLGEGATTEDSGGVTPWGASIDISAVCEACNGTGWTPLPPIGKGPHTMNCWVRRLFNQGNVS